MYCGAQNGMPRVSRRVDKVFTGERLTGKIFRVWFYSSRAFGFSAGEIRLGGRCIHRGIVGAASGHVLFVSLLNLVSKGMLPSILRGGSHGKHIFYGKYFGLQRSGAPGG